jgi:hypothetical protein
VSTADPQQLTHAIMNISYYKTMCWQIYIFLSCYRTICWQMYIFL